jgi:hypothetical protein
MHPRLDLVKKVKNKRIFSPARLNPDFTQKQPNIPKALTLFQWQDVTYVPAHTSK